MRKLQFIGFLCAIMAVGALASCGGSGAALSTPGLSQSPAVTAEGDISGYDMSNLPSIPLDTGDAKISSATPGDPPAPPVITVLGKDYLQMLNGTVEGDALVLSAPAAPGDSDATSKPQPACATYRVGGMMGLRALSLNIECVPAQLDQRYFVGIADYTNFKWRWFGPVHFPEFQLDLRGHNQQFVTQLGNMYFVIVCPPGNGATHYQTSVITGPRDPGGMPGGPHHLVATDGQLAEKVGLSWEAGLDVEHYAVMRKAARANAPWEKIGETTETKFVDQPLPDYKLFFYAVRSFNANGQSARSNVDSGFAGGGDDPCVVRGDITGPAGKPLPGIRVVLVGFGEEAMRITDDQGRFLFGDLPPGRYIVLPMRPELDFTPRYAIADVRDVKLAELHFNAVPDAPFHRVWGFAYEYVGDPASKQPPEFQPLAGVTIQLHPADQPDKLITVQTDDNGFYHFEDLPLGVYLEQAAMDGYGFLPQIVEVVVNGENRPDRRDFIGFAGGVPPPPPPPPGDGGGNGSL